jgi:hypothetical protein
VFSKAGFKLWLAIFDNDPEGKIFGAKLGGQHRFLFFNGRCNQLTGDLVDRQVTYSCFTELMDETVKVCLSCRERRIGTVSSQPYLYGAGADR